MKNIDQYIWKHWTWNPIKWVRALITRFTNTERIQELKKEIRELENILLAARQEAQDFQSALTECQATLREEIQKANRYREGLKVARNSILNTLGEEE